MEQLEYKIDIAAPVKTVWNTMLQEATYKQWAGKSWPESSYKGKWAKGEKISFVGSDGSGTLAEVAKLVPNDSIFMRHVAVLEKGGKEDRTSDVAKGWVGTTEGYKFEEKQGKTTLTVTLEINPEWKKMFDEGWPVALQELKRISEQQR
jgi:uncharacterized protein YndB with AHSA1/START domain